MTRQSLQTPPRTPTASQDFDLSPQDSTSLQQEANLLFSPQSVIGTNEHCAGSVNEPTIASSTSSSPGNTITRPPPVPSSDSSSSTNSKETLISRSRPSTSQWMMPTSGEIAFLAALPRPIVRAEVDERAAIISTSSSSSTKEHADLPPEESEYPTAEDIFAASAREWTALLDGGLVFHRRDTWAVGDKWGRHVRVFEVSDEAMRNERRKRSC